MFWAQTPRETWAVLRARTRSSQRAALFTAWHVAAFQRQDRLPDLAELVARVSGDAETEQSAEEQIAVAAALAARGAKRGTT